MNTTPITKNLIALNVILYIVAEYIFPFLKPYLVAYLPSSPIFHSWQVITHMFMYGDMFHLLFNMFTLWSFGTVLEHTLGAKKFIILYFLSGLGAFILFNVWNYYQVYQLHQVLAQEGVDIRQIYIDAANHLKTPLPDDTQASYALRSYLSVPMLGASGAVFGVVAGFSTLFPNAKMMMMFIPFPIKAKFLLPIVIVISAYLGVKQFSWDNIAHFAHIGGALVGWLMILNWKKNRDRWM